MPAYSLWLIIGIVLIITEMASGTFYFLVLGGTAFVAAMVAWFDASFSTQVLTAVAVGLVGCVWLNARRRAARSPAMRPLDVGQPVALDAWIDQASGRARVRYRDALWDAAIQGESRGDPGEVFYIVAMRGNVLEVSRTRP